MSIRLTLFTIVLFLRLYNESLSFAIMLYYNINFALREKIINKDGIACISLLLPIDRLNRFTK